MSFISFHSLASGAFSLCCGFPSAKRYERLFKGEAYIWGCVAGMLMRIWLKAAQRRSCWDGRKRSVATSRAPSVLFLLLKSRQKYAEYAAL